MPDENAYNNDDQFRKAVLRELDQIREAQTATNTKIDNMILTELNTVKADMLVLKNQMAPIQKLFWAIITAAALALVGTIWTISSQGNRPPAAVISK